jgi:hypothetical protein
VHIDRETGVISFELPIQLLPAVTREETALSDPCHANWLRVGYALREVTRALASVVDVVARSFHRALQKKMQGAQKYVGKTALYDPENQEMKVLEPWAKEIISHHRKLRKRGVGVRDANWENSDARKLCHEGGHWELMKLFCRKIRSRDQALKVVIDARSTPFGLLAAIVQHCDAFSGRVCTAAITNAQRARAYWAHNPRLAFTDDEADHHLRNLSKLLREPGFAMDPLSREAVAVLETELLTCGFAVKLNQKNVPKKRTAVGAKNRTPESLPVESDLQPEVEPVVVDGSMLEGGGQILRMATALGALTATPVFLCLILHEPQLRSFFVTDTCGECSRRPQGSWTCHTTFGWGTACAPNRNLRQVHTTAENAVHID